MLMSRISTKPVGDNYPFSPRSTMKLTEKLKLPAQSFELCKLCILSIDESVTYAYISRIYHQDQTGFIELSSSTGSRICVLSFDLSSSGNSMTGQAKDMNGLSCGFMRISKNILPVFFGDHKPQPDSFILLPSACSFIPVTNTVQYDRLRGDTPILTYNNKPIEDVLGDGTTVTGKLSSGGLTIVRADSPELDYPREITSIQINGVLVSDPSHQLITTDAGGLRIKSENNRIVIGRLADL